jgi:hypothetical protein
MQDMIREAEFQKSREPINEISFCSETMIPNTLTVSLDEFFLR